MKQREDLLSDARDLFMSGVSPESAFNWILVLVPSFPKTTSKRPALVKLHGATT